MAKWAVNAEESTTKSVSNSYIISIITDRIPGYEAPPGGPTVAIQGEIFGPFVAALAALDGDPGAALDVSDSADERIALWALMHGLVMLEINHHPPFVEDTTRVFDRALRRRFPT